ncbi:alpha-(1,3)-fucosyltransferase 7 [Lepeophtheirus salmonis]|uniref:alpha-(1,3)-fucosyltransferase 7 n=1 Tax=Lepeophtheirus salmonis TaxID=72036 RepID=UPI001AE6B12C|nr:alpha-(1,3)-fucosyltransferase 7-like [Lepeophtheirus salmonis]
MRWIHDIMLKQRLLRECFLLIIVFSLVLTCVLILILATLRKNGYLPEEISGGFKNREECRNFMNKRLNASSLAWICEKVVDIKWKVFSPEINHYSELGKRLNSELFSFERKKKDQEIFSNRTYLILIWKHGPYLSRRFLRSFSNSKENDPFQCCSVSNCQITYSDEKIRSSDAVVIHLHRINGPHALPLERTALQRWIFFTDESPYHTFLEYKGPSNKIASFDGVFNWSMTFRHDSDIPVPYGRTIRIKDTLIQPDIYSNKPKFLAAMASNCGGISRRWDFINELKKYLVIDVFGGCGDSDKQNVCPGKFTRDCPAIDPYKFFLAFENSACKEYITEKFWWNALAKKSIPVVLGGLSRQDYEMIAPPNSFIHVNDFKGSNPQRDLALFLKILNESSAFITNFIYGDDISRF